MSYDGFAPPRQISWTGDVGMAQYGPSDDRLFVAFYTKPVHNPIQSAAAGTPIFEDRDFVRIQHPGETLNIIDRPVVQSDKARWPRHWAAYLEKKSQVPDGTPIDLLFPAHPAVAQNLRGLGIFTIEQCAHLSSQAMDTIGMGAQEYVNRAQEYLNGAVSGANSMWITKMSINGEEMKLGQGN